tara:strand:+ start:687 stop:1361 length:675 start_codon:yes stop_codon:yes gene_type:complete
MKQERFNPSTNVSNWQGRSEYLKGYPGKAMSGALNGGFFGGAGQDPMERWTYITSPVNGVSGNYGVDNINTATPKYDEILIWCMSSQNNDWAGAGSIYLGHPSESGGYGVGGSAWWQRGQTDGWSYGIEPSSSLEFHSGLSQYSASIWIYVTNCASTTDYKPFYARHAYSGNQQGGYLYTQWAHGIVARTTVMNSFFVRNPWGSGSSSYQNYCVWGGRRAGEAV